MQKNKDCHQKSLVVYVTRDTTGNKRKRLQSGTHDVSEDFGMYSGFLADCCLIIIYSEHKWLRICCAEKIC